jgi:dienelactone hydrolase
VSVGQDWHVNGVALPDGRRVALPLRLLARPEGMLRGYPLVIFFHGAVDQMKRPWPFFDGTYALRPLSEAGAEAVILSLADPALWLSKDLRMAWYAPSRYFDTPGVLRALFRGLVARLAPQRLVFVGGSTGAHAALTHAAAFPDSVCMVTNPITRIAHYYPNLVAKYLAVCWRSERRLETLPAGFEEDCGVLYRCGPHPLVVVLQNPTDHHFTRQAAHFAAQVGDDERLLFLARFYPDWVGHAFPAPVMAQMVVSCTLVAPLGRAEIGREFVGRCDGDAAPPSGPSATAQLARDPAPRDLPPRDLAVAARLAAMATGG